jgi:hypothetical protein
MEFAVKKLGSLGQPDITQGVMERNKTIPSFPNGLLVCEPGSSSSLHRYQPPEHPRL